jgi:hypothetical protein
MKQISYTDQRGQHWALFTQGEETVLACAETMHIATKKKDIAYHMQGLTVTDKEVTFDKIIAMVFSTDKGNRYYDVTISNKRFFFVTDGISVMKAVAEKEYFDVQKGNKEKATTINFERIVQAIFKRKEHTRALMAC